MFYSHYIFLCKFILYIKICILHSYIISHETIDNITIKIYNLIKIKKEK